MGPEKADKRDAGTYLFFRRVYGDPISLYFVMWIPSFRAHVRNAHAMLASGEEQLGLALSQTPCDPSR